MIIKLFLQYINHQVTSHKQTAKRIDGEVVEWDFGEWLIEGVGIVVEGHGYEMDGYEEEEQAGGYEVGGERGVG